MAIGEFGGAPVVPGDSGVLVSTPLYWFYEMTHAALNPSRAWADATRLFFKNPGNPLSYTTFGKSVAAGDLLIDASSLVFRSDLLSDTSELVLFRTLGRGEDLASGLHDGSESGCRDADRERCV